MYTFYNVLDLSAIIAWIICKNISKEAKLSTEAFIQLLAEALRRNHISSKKKYLYSATTRNRSLEEIEMWNKTF